MADCQKLGRDVRVTAAVERYDVVGDGPLDSGPVNRGLEVFKARVSIVKSGQHVEYLLRVSCEGRSWQLKKRFSEFAALQETLVKRLHSVPALPAKSVVRQFDAEHLESRKQGLSQYLQSLCQRRDVLNCPEVQEFLGLPEHVVSFKQQHPSEPLQVAEVHEAAFGITDFAYDPVQGLLLLGASDCSWTSRMDTKITNIKLPWEPSAPNLPTSQMSLWRQFPGDLRFDVQFTSRYAASLTAVALLATPSVPGAGAQESKGFCLCGLSDGTVGCHTIQNSSGIHNAGAILPLLRHTAGVTALVCDPVRQWLVTASKDTAMIVYDLRRQAILGEVSTKGAPCSAMFYCEAQKRLFTGLQSGRVMVWDLSDTPPQQLCTIPDGGVEAAAYTTKVAALDYDGPNHTLFTGAKEGLSLWAVKGSSTGCWGRCAGTIGGLSSAPTAMAWSSSSREIIAGFGSGAVIVFDVDSGLASYAFQAHDKDVTSLVWLDAPRRLLTSSKDKTMKVWDFPSLQRMTLEDQVVGIEGGVSSPLKSGQKAKEPQVSGASSASRRGRPAGQVFSLSGGDPLLGAKPHNAAVSVSSAASGSAAGGGGASGSRSGADGGAHSGHSGPLGGGPLGGGPLGAGGSREGPVEAPAAPAAAAAGSGLVIDPLGRPARRSGGDEAALQVPSALTTAAGDPLTGTPATATPATSFEEQVPEPVQRSTAAATAPPRRGGGGGAPEAPRGLSGRNDSDDDLLGWDG